MPASAYGVALGIAVFGGAIAVYLQRRLPHSLLASRWTSLLFGASVAVAFRLATGRFPSSLWPGPLGSAEPWELVVFPLVIVTLAWPILRELAARSMTLRLWIAMALSSLPLLIALPAGESYADVVAGNAVWSILALLAIGANYIAGEQLDATGATRWSLWVFVAQLFTVAALLMTCYGTLGEWCAVAALTLGVLAGCRVLVVHDAPWSSVLALSATALSCILLTHIRVYSTQVLPAWLAPLPMFSPVIICSIDQLLSRHRPAWIRVVSAAAASAIVAVAVIATALSISGEGSGE